MGVCHQFAVVWDLSAIIFHFLSGLGGDDVTAHIHTFIADEYGRAIDHHTDLRV